jgi:hypothetical protein
MRHALLVIVLALSTATACAQAPAYQRTRGGAGDWHARGGHAQNWRDPYGGIGGFYNPYFVAPPIVTGSYYQRPYPYHFDYYRNRWGGPALAEGSVTGAATPDCPCVVPPPLEVVE